MASLFWKKLKFLYVQFTQGIIYMWDKLTDRGRIKKEDERNIEGKVVIITGANSGIGKEASYEFTIRKSTVVMACRNLEAGSEAIKEHRKRALDSGITFPLDFDLMHLDLSDFSSIRTFCSEVKSKYSLIHILVNNAGIFNISNKIRRTNNGIEEHIAINYLSHFLLTNLLLDVMKGEPFQSNNNESKEACRILEVSSSTQIQSILLDEDNLMISKNDSKDPETRGMYFYGLSKFYGSLFTKELNQRLNQNGAIAYSLCPGLVRTGIFRSLNWYRTAATNITLFFFSISLARGCDTILYLSLTKDPPEGGLVYRFSKPLPYINKRLEKSDKLGKKIWELSEEVVGLSS